MKKVWTTALILMLFSCKGQKDVLQTGQRGERVKLLVKEQFVPTEDGGMVTLVATNFKELNTFYRDINKTRKPGLPVPQVDFSKEAVILVCSGALSEDINLFKVSGEKDTYLITSSQVGYKGEESATMPLYVFVVAQPINKIQVRNGLKPDN